MTLTGKQSLFSKYIFTIGSESFGNGVESARRAGYKGNDNTLAQTAHKLVINGKIIAEKQRIQAELVKKMDITVNECIDSLALDIRGKDTNKRDKYKAMDLLGEFKGWKRDKAPNEEAEAARAKRMTAEQRKTAEIVAKMRTDEEARTVPIRKLNTA